MNIQAFSRLFATVVFLSSSCLGSEDSYRFIECPPEIQKTPADVAQKPDFIDVKHSENLPIIGKLEPEKSHAEPVLAISHQIIRVGDGQKRGEVVFKSTFLQKNNFSHVTPVVLLDGLSLSAESVLLLLVDNAKPFAPVVLLKMIKTPEGWREEVRREVASTYVNYMEKSEGELRYELALVEPNGGVRVIAKRMPSAKVEFDEVFTLPSHRPGTTLPEP